VVIAHAINVANLAILLVNVATVAVADLVASAAAVVVAEPGFLALAAECEVEAAVAEVEFAATVVIALATFRGNAMPILNDVIGVIFSVILRGIAPETLIPALATTVAKEDTCSANAPKSKRRLATNVSRLNTWLGIAPIFVKVVAMPAVVAVAAWLDAVSTAVVSGILLETAPRTRMPVIGVEKVVT
jgi:hypothetical protein